MGDRLYQISQPITVTYQSAGSVTGLTVQMDVYDETGAVDAVQSGVMTESLSIPGTYSRAFTPDAEGGWIVRVSDSANSKVVKGYSVGPANLKTVYAAIVDLDADVSGLATQVQEVQDAVENPKHPPMIA